MSFWQVFLYIYMKLLIVINYYRIIMRDVDFYRTRDNIAPVETFLRELDVKMRAKALHELKILAE